MDLFVAGNVQTILQGHVTEQTLYTVPLKAMPYALGGAALPDMQPLEVGETMVYEGVGHIFTVKKPWKEQTALHTAFLMGIRQRPSIALKVIGLKSINDLYTELLKQYPNGFAITGKAHFANLSIAYMQLSPIYNENINVLHDKYWHVEALQNIGAKLFGVVLKKADPRAFYQNPNEKEAAPLISHTHVLMPDARHLLTDSMLSSGEFWIEEIKAVHSFNSTDP